MAWHHLKNRRDPGYTLPWAKPKLSVWCEQSPLSESRVTLSRKRDTTGLFRADITWRISGLVIDIIRRDVAVVRQSFAACGIADIVPDADLHGDRIYKKCTDSFHHSRGTRMAARPEDGVVDPDLRLHGVENAFVCSASVFPCSGVALAARLAEHLDGLLGSRRR